MEDLFVDCCGPVLRVWLIDSHSIRVAITPSVVCSTAGRWVMISIIESNSFGSVVSR